MGAQMRQERVDVAGDEGVEVGDGGEGRRRLELAFEVVGQVSKLQPGERSWVAFRSSVGDAGGPKGSLSDWSKSLQVNRLRRSMAVEVWMRRALSGGAHEGLHQSQLPQVSSNGWCRGELPL